MVGLVRNGDGPTLLLRADMDALPVAEATGLPYASHTTATDGAGNEVPVMHACGHDMHVACLLGAAHLLAASRDSWSGTVVALFQPAEETGDGARGMLDDGLATLVPKVDVALAQHVLPAPAGLVGTHPGPTLSAADSMRITLHGRGAHGSMPQASVGKQARRTAGGPAAFEPGHPCTPAGGRRTWRSPPPRTPPSPRGEPARSAAT